MDAASAWQELFENWPSDAPKIGIIVTNYQENIGFSDFMTADGLLAVERDRPDSIGARKVIVAYTAILAVKMTDTGDLSNVASLGFSRH